MKRARMGKRFSAIVLNSIATLALQLAIISNASVSNLRIFMNEMESMALSVSQEVEKIYADRCNRLSSCVSFHECKSTFREATTECRTDYVADCKDVENSGCGKTYDFFQTNVRIPSQLLNTQTSQPEGAHLKEDICYSNSMTETFKNTAENLEKTSDRILQPPQTFFGTSNGMFRIWPAQHSEVCGIMDTRIRPWFVAASSGPKDVVIVIDKSGSMAVQNRWNLAINAAKSVIDTLTIGDHFSVVLFSDTAETLGFPTLMRATAENKEAVLKALDQSIHIGTTNYGAAFDKAFDLFELSETTEISSNCHRAILFLSDGKPTVADDSKTGTELYTHIAEKNIFDATIFSYALGESADKEALKNIACTSGGIYANIPDNGDLVQQMSAYYKLYAILQGGSENMNFTTWVEPYLYSSGVMGTTVSTPVFDRSKDTPLWIGVVGVDFTISELEEAVGGTDSYQAVLDELVAASTATCPNITKNSEQRICLIEALRRDDSSECHSSDSSYSPSCSLQTVTPELCSEVSLPSMFWENANTQDYKSRGCCSDGAGVCTEASAESDNKSSSSTGLPSDILGIGIGLSLPAIILGFLKCVAPNVGRRCLKVCGCENCAKFLFPDARENTKHISQNTGQIESNKAELVVQKNELETFIKAQRLPRLVDITPDLLEGSVNIADEGDVLGRGGYGVVYRAHYKKKISEYPFEQRLQVAVKCLFYDQSQQSVSHLPNDVANRVKKEAKILCSLNHPNIIKIYGVVSHKGWLVMELCGLGSVKSCIRNSQRLPPEQLLRIANDIACGVSYLHDLSISIIHGDLKLDNVLLRDDGSAVLCDFGMSEAKNRSKTMTRAVPENTKVTMQWTAPELFQGQQKTVSSDIYALGVTLYELFEDREPFEGFSDALIMHNVINGARPTLAHTPVEIQNLITAAWDQSPKLRPSAAQIACLLAKY
jgi:Mg-chelatase subunit ChlD